MGMVFAWGDVLARRIPDLKSFVWAVEEARRAFTDDPSIIGAIACGSVIRGDHNIRSDLDIFVLYDPNEQHAAFDTMGALSLEASFRHVPLVCIPCDTLVARTRMHHIGPSFKRHLEQSVAAGGLLKGDPLARLSPSVDLGVDIESYLRVKMHSLQESFGTEATFTDERRVAYAKKLIEAPMHIARKTLAHQGLLAGDSKARICELYREHMPKALAEQLDSLVGLDERYTRELNEQLECPNRQAYDDVMYTLLHQSGAVLDFIRDNLMFVSETAP